jgi:hypothetical protein
MVSRVRWHPFLDRLFGPAEEINGAERCPTSTITEKK